MTMTIGSARSNAASTTNSTFPNVSLNGSAYAKTKELVRLEVETSLRMPGMATLYFNDTSDHAKAKEFTLGKKIELTIAGAPEGKKPVIFKGEVVAIEACREALQAMTVVRCYDDLAKAFLGRKTRTFLKQKYGDIVKKVASENGLTVGSVDSGGLTHEYVLQHDESDGEFLERLAAEYGFVVTLDPDWKLTFGPAPTAKGGGTLPSSGRAADKQLLLGEDLTNYEIAYGPAVPATKVKTFGWDPKKKEKVEEFENLDLTKSLVKLKNLQPPAGEGEFLLSSMALPVGPEAKQAAKGFATRIASSLATLRGTVTGNPFLCAGVEVSVGPDNNSFAGWYVITAARHTFESGRLTTEIVCDGLGGDRGTSASAAMSMLPGVNAAASSGSGGNFPYLVTGVVTDVNDKEEKLGRVKVKIPTLGMDTNGSHWLRVISHGNGPNRGIWWLPEVGDEVVCGFEQGDMRYGYVLGGLHNGKDKPEFGAKAVTSDGKVITRALTTTSGHQLAFGDEKDSEVIELHSGDKKYVMKYDQAKAVFTINVNDKALMIKLDDAAGIVIEAEKKIVIESKSGDIEMKAMNVKIEAKSNFEVKASGQAKIEGTGGFEAKGTTAKVQGQAQAELSASGQTAVKGSIVQIN